MTDKDKAREKRGFEMRSSATETTPITGSLMRGEGLPKITTNLLTTFLSATEGTVAFTLRPVIGKDLINREALLTEMVQTLTKEGTLLDFAT